MPPNSGGKGIKGDLRAKENSNLLLKHLKIIPDTEAMQIKSSFSH